MDVLVTAKLLALLVTANGLPVLAALLAGHHWNRPIDLGCRFPDGRPLLGASKTFRGLLASVGGTLLLAPLLGYSAASGALFALLAMSGDLLTSFTKRRLGFQSSRSLPLLDQLPETLLPLLLMQQVLGATAGDIIAAVTAFVVIDLLLDQLLEKIRRRKGYEG